jgi:hypothetical protein
MKRPTTVVSWTHFSPSAMSRGDRAHAVNVSSLSVVGITIVTLMTLGLILVTSLADRRFSLQALELESSRYAHV